MTLKKQFQILIGAVLLSLIIINACHAQVIANETLSEWKGFTKHRFTINGSEAWYVVPKNPAKGNPWVWRAYFPDWHTDMDSILLTRGFFIAYVKAPDLFGHYSAINIWDDFYHYLTGAKEFAMKPALEAVSRGGLYAYGWAKRNPSKVSCIYAEAPVCDFTSWPGGRGAGNGSATDWAKLLAVYGLTDLEAMGYKDQPKDNLGALAAYKVPILHVVGLKDSIVPYTENTALLVQNYVGQGGPATVIPMTRGPQEMHGHHFKVEHPEQLADFICEHSLPVRRPLRASQFIEDFGRLDNLVSKIKDKEAVRVAFLGGSITHMSGWRDIVMRWLTERFPKAHFDFINAGIPSLGSLPHAFRLQNDVLNKGCIDLLFIESAVNDYVNKTPAIVQQRALEGIIRHALSSNPYMNVVLMGFTDEFKLADYSAGRMPREIQLHEQLARYYHLPFINLAKEVYRRIQNNEFSWAYDFKNLHPSAFGQALYANTIQTLLYNSLSKQTERKPEKVFLPKAKDPLCYMNGTYLSLKEANLVKGFTLNPSWTPEDNAHTRPGFVKIPVLEGTEAGATLTAEFKGTAVGIAVLSGPDAGIIRYSIDGKPWKMTDLYTEWSSGLHLPWYILLGDGLSNGKHRLTITITGKRNVSSKGNAVRIAHFLINK